MIDTLLYATTGIAVVCSLAAWVYNRKQAARLRDLQKRIDLYRSVADRLLPSDLYKKVADDIRVDAAEIGVRPEGKSPDLAAPYAEEAKHPLYAKTGLPNQPVASLRPDPTPCSKCGKPRAWTAGKLYGKDATLAHCNECRVSETPKAELVYTGYPLQRELFLKPNWACPDCSYRSYQPRAGKPRCPICKGLET